MTYKYGHFNEDGSEFSTTDPRTPRAFDNFIWNESVYSNIQQTGVGCMDYQIGDTEAVQMFTGVGRICDFDVFGRDHLMSRLIYIRDNDTGEFWNLNWEPVCKEYDSYECVHGLGYSIIRTTVNGIAAELRIFVPKGNDPVELWTLRFRNTEERARSLSVFVYNQFQLKYKAGFDSYGDMIFRGAWMNLEHNAVVVSKHPFRKPHNHLVAFMSADRAMTAFDGNRDAFVGTYNTLSRPNAVVQGRCSNSPGSSEATIGAAQYDLALEPAGSGVFSVIIGVTDEESGIGVLRGKYLGNVEFHFNELRAEKKAFAAKNHVVTPDPHFNRIMNHWVKQAAQYGATWCRWGWNGYRDIVQHGLGIVALDPARTRSILLTALRYQNSTGLALRGWNPVDEKTYSDSALWLVFTLVAYLTETADMELLKEKVPYYDEGEATVLEHVEKALDFLENNKGAHKLCLIKFGDWNDSLTGVGKEGRGESVWLSQAYAEAMRQMGGLMYHLKNFPKAREYSARRIQILDAINNEAWDGRWYTRCFDDSGCPIGSKSNESGKIFMESQSWALISGAASEARAEALIDSCDDLLNTPSGYLLLAPSFTKFDSRIGRISSLEPGVCENGTVYSHLNIWMILGLLRYGKADKAYEVFKKITPGYVTGAEDLKQQCPPYMYANCYYGPSHRNNSFQMEFTWITGSVAWYNTVLANDMLGVRADYDGLIVDPCLPSSWGECEIERTFRGAVYQITIRNPNRIPHGRVELTMDGEGIHGNKLPVCLVGSRHVIEAVILPETRAGKPSSGANSEATCLSLVLEERDIAEAVVS